MKYQSKSSRGIKKGWYLWSRNTKRGKCNRKKKNPFWEWKRVDLLTFRRIDEKVGKGKL